MCACVPCPCAGWKPVDVGEDFLLGAEEGGFAGLEMLDDASIIDPSMLGMGHAVI